MLILFDCLRLEDRPKIKKKSLAFITRFKTILGLLKIFREIFHDSRSSEKIFRKSWNNSLTLFSNKRYTKLLEICGLS